MSHPTANQRIYDGEGDQLLVDHQLEERIVLVPDGKPASKPDPSPRVRILWGQHLLDDLLAGRYRSLVCAVNAEDNSHGVISQVATLLPTSQWDVASITAYTKLFAHRSHVGVIKFDFDSMEVLGLLCPTGRTHLTLADLKAAFEIVARMLAKRPDRRPTASVSFLGARANRLIDESDPAAGEPSFEAVLRTMHEAGFDGDVYPAPWMWESAPTAVFARFPFPESIQQMRHGGF